MVLKSIFRQAILFLATFLVFLSCNKDSSSTQNPEILLNTYKWKIQSVLVDNVNNTLDFYDECELDDFWLFRNGGVLELHSATLKCSPSDPEIDLNTWSFSTEDKILNIGLINFKMIAISNTSMQLKLESVAENVIYIFIVL